MGYVTLMNSKKAKLLRKIAKHHSDDNPQYKYVYNLAKKSYKLETLILNGKK